MGQLLRLVRWACVGARCWHSAGRTTDSGAPIQSNTRSLSAWTRVCAHVSLTKSLAGVPLLTPRPLRRPGYPRRRRLQGCDAHTPPLEPPSRSDFPCRLLTAVAPASPGFVESPSPVSRPCSLSCTQAWLPRGCCGELVSRPRRTAPISGTLVRQPSASCGDADSHSGVATGGSLALASPRRIQAGRGPKS